MQTKLKVLLLEDNLADTDLVLHELRRSGFEVEAMCVDTEEDYIAQLKPAPDIILADYDLPAFDGLSALRIKRRICPEVPFIFVTGMLGEELAIETLRNGATDYVMKERLSRLSVAVERALEDVEAHRQREKDRQLLVYQAHLLANVTDAIVATDDQFILTYWNRAAEGIYGWRADEVLGKNRLEVFQSQFVGTSLEEAIKCLREQGKFQGVLLQQTKERGVVCIETKTIALRNDNGDLTGYVGVHCDVTERKKSEQSLRQAEEKYRSIFENAIEGIFQTTPEGRYLTANPALAKMRGYESPEELLSQVTDIEHQLYVDPNRRVEYRRLLTEQDHVHNFEYQTYHRDGSIVWFSKNVRAVRDEQGNVLYHEGTVKDITDQKRAEEALLQSEERYKRLLAAVTDYVYTVTLEKERVVSTLHGAGCEAVTGYTSLDYASDPHLWYRMIHEQDRRLALEQISKALSGRTAPSVELRIYHKDGSLRWVRSSAVPRTDGLGRVVSYDGLITDITERKQLEEELAKAHWREDQEKGIRFDAIVRSMAEGILVINKEGIIQFVNESAKKLINEENAELVGEPFVKMVEVREWKDFTERVLEGNGNFWTGKLILPSATGDRHLQLRAESIEIPEEGRTGSICVLSDVTNFYAMDRMKSDLVSFVSHELRTPLTVIKGYASTLLRLNVQQLKDLGQEALASINSNVDRLTRLIDTFLNISKIDSGHALELSLDEIDVPSMIEEAVQLEQAISPGSKIDICQQDCLPKLLGDRDKLLLVLSNLLSNANKYSPTEGEVRISVSSDSAGFHLAVTDKGMGISEEDQSRVFARFQRGNDSSLAKVRGTGIGLYLAKQVVEAHGGVIEVTSEVGVGTTFSFIIPHRLGKGSQERGTA